jgi:monothiol glutaredoxin
MELDEAGRSRIETILQNNRVVLFMKGTPAQPQCGFSAKTTQILNMLLPDYATVDVLADPEIRAGIKAYGDWPTIPQLYVDSELVGGCDIVSEMYQQGALHELLSLELPPKAAPKIDISASATAILQEALAAQPEKSLWLSVDAGWSSALTLGSDDDGAIKIELDGVVLFMDPMSAQRADGLKIDVQETLQGHRFHFENPNAPPPVKSMTVSLLSDMLQSGDIVNLFDIRPAAERAVASIAQARPLDAEAIQAIEGLEKDAVLVFHCHTGMRSQADAERYRLHGFTNVYNLEGGIEAWSLEVDPSVPRY